LAPDTIRFYKAYVGQWETARAAAPEGQDPVMTLRSLLSTKTSTTGRSAFAAIRAYEFWIEEQTGERSWLRKCRRWKFDPAPEVQPLSEAEFTQILFQCKRSSASDRRDRILFTILWATGARLGAVVGLRREDVDLENRTLRVHTKGNVQAPIVLPDGCAAVLGKWMEQNPSASGGWLFPAPLDDSRHISDSWVSHRFHKLAKQAGITRRVWVHLLRHSFATRMLNKGVSITSVQRQLCHSTIHMTLRYGKTSLARVDEEMRAAG
jgi:site-specific recombinase XerD